MNALDRRRFLQLAGLTAGAATLSACAGTGSSEEANEEGPVESLTFWSSHPGESKEIEQSLLEAYTAQTGTAVSLVTGGANYEELAQKFNAALSGGDLPDVVLASDVTWFNFALNKAITPMDELWKSGKVDSAGYVDSLREDYEFESQHYALPYARSTPLFYYNQDLWTAAGLPDRGPETWPEFAAWAPRLKAANAGVAPLTLPNGSNYLDWIFQGMVWTFGGSYSKDWTPTFTSPETIKAGEFLQDQFRQGNITITNDEDNQFTAVQAASLVGSTGSLRGLTEAAKFDIKTAFLPGPPPGCPTGGAGLTIPARISDARKTKAMELVAFLTNTKNTITFTQNTGYMPVRKDALEDPSTVAYLEKNPNARTALEQLKITQSQDYARVFLPGGGARIGAALDRITIGKQDVRTVFSELAEESTTVYERDIEPKL
jgi:sn-glycerol 3-phosphate transport system substrate-binding protein